jgi:hypothetical protein
LLALSGNLQLEMRFLQLWEKRPYQTMA